MTKALLRLTLATLLALLAAGPARADSFFTALSNPTGVSARKLNASFDIAVDPSIITGPIFVQVAYYVPGAFALPLQHLTISAGSTTGFVTTGDVYDWLTSLGFPTASSFPALAVEIETSIPVSVIQRESRGRSEVAFPLERGLDASGAGFVLGTLFVASTTTTGDAYVVLINPTDTDILVDTREGAGGPTVHALPARAATLVPLSTHGLFAGVDSGGTAIAVLYLNAIAGTVTEGQLLPNGP